MTNDDSGMEVTGRLGTDFNLASDVTNSPAIIYLTTLMEQGKLAPTQVDVLKASYTKLHEFLLKTMENENELLKHLKALSSERLVGKHKLEKANSLSWENNTAMGNLHRDKAKALNEVALAQERETLLLVETTELQRQQADLENKLANLKRVTREMVEPRIMGLNREITDLGEAISSDRNIGLSLAREKEAALKRIAGLVADKEKANQMLLEHRQTHAKVRTEPEKIHKQAEVVLSAKQNLDAEVTKLSAEVASLDATLKTQAARRKELEDERVTVHLYLEGQREQFEARERVSQDIIRELELAKEEASVHIEQGVQLDRDVKEAAAGIKAANEQLLRSTRERDQVLKQVRKAEFQIANIAAQFPNAEAQVAHLTLEVQGLKVEKKRNRQMIEDLRNEVDVYVHGFLSEEGAGKIKTEALTQELAAIKAAEAEVAELAKDEHRLNQEIAAKTLAREIKAREASKAARNAKETLEDLRIKSKTIAELTKQYTEMSNRHRELQKLYERVKTDRNRHVKLIQACGQQIAELKEKIKILQNEVEILRNESQDLDKALGRNRTEMANTKNIRDALRSETNKATFECREKQKIIDQQIAQIDKLNAIINSAEEEMLQIKRQYESAVEDRNFAGIQLIDRNDELCILYEKLNIQEDILRRGELDFRSLEEERRLLIIEEKDIERTIAVHRKQLPLIPSLEKQVAEAQKELIAERKRSAQLSEDLENPTNLARWRALEGNDPSPEQLAQKIQSLEVALNEKKEQLLEKDLILDEVTVLSDRLRAQASVGREDTLDLSKKVNDFQHRIKETTRKMMGIVAELSIYQATAMKLSQEKAELESTLNVAREAWERGDPPTEDAEKEWYRMERERLTRREQLLASLEAKAREGPDAQVPVGSVRTTAEPRPNAYIPVGIGLPRPYGGAAPFKPSELGSNIRHIRKPKKLEIEI